MFSKLLYCEPMFLYGVKLWFHQFLQLPSVCTAMLSVDYIRSRTITRSNVCNDNYQAYVLLCFPLTISGQEL